MTPPSSPSPAFRPLLALPSFSLLYLTCRVSVLTSPSLTPSSSSASYLHPLLLRLHPLLDPSLTLSSFFFSSPHILSPWKAFSMAYATLPCRLCSLMQVFSGLKEECVDCAINHFHGSWSQSGAESWLQRKTKNKKHDNLITDSATIDEILIHLNIHILSTPWFPSWFRDWAQFISSAYISMLTRHWFYWPHYTAGNWPDKTGVM